MKVLAVGPFPEEFLFFQAPQLREMHAEMKEVSAVGPFPEEFLIFQAVPAREMHAEIERAPVVGYFDGFKSFPIQCCKGVV